MAAPVAATATRLGLRGYFTRFRHGLKDKLVAAAGDYRDSFKQLAVDMKDHPVKTAAWYACVMCVDANLPA